MILDLKLSPCFESCMYYFEYFPGVRLWFADVSEPSISSIFKPLKMELIEGSETSANYNRTPGKYPKEYIQDFMSYKSLQIIHFTEETFTFSHKLTPCMRWRKGILRKNLSQPCV